MEIRITGLKPWHKALYALAGLLLGIVINAAVDQFDLMLDLHTCEQASGRECDIVISPRPNPRD